MRKSIYLKFFSRLLLVVMLTVAINGVHESAAAIQSHMTAASDQVSSSEISATRQCPCSPIGQHKDFDNCDTCINCACHAPLTVQKYNFSYNPSVLNIQTSDPFKYIPEVYLSKFIPPQNQA